jgi:hypothetical protein
MLQDWFRISRGPWRAPVRWVRPRQARPQELGSSFRSGSRAEVFASRPARLGAIDVALAARRFCQFGLEIVTDHGARRAAHEGERVNMCADPVGNLIRAKNNFNKGRTAAFPLARPEAHPQGSGRTQPGDLASPCRLLGELPSDHRVDGEGPRSISLGFVPRSDVRDHWRGLAQYRHARLLAADP